MVQTCNCSSSGSLRQRIASSRPAWTTYFSPPKVKRIGKELPRMLEVWDSVPSIGGEFPWNFLVLVLLRSCGFLSFHVSRAPVWPGDWVEDLEWQIPCRTFYTSKSRRIKRNGALVEGCSFLTQYYWKPHILIKKKTPQKWMEPWQCLVVGWDRELLGQFWNSILSYTRSEFPQIKTFCFWTTKKK